MTSAPTLTDGVVTLRAHRDDDIERCLEQCLDPVSQQWTTVPIPYTREDAKRFVRHAMPGGWEMDQEWAFALEYDGAYGGTISLRNEGDGRAEVAYGSHPAVRGRGVMERALRLLLGWGFAPVDAGGRGLQTVIWWANEGNWASRKLAWRLGFSCDGTVREWLPQRGRLLNGWVGSLGRDDLREPRHRWLDIPVVELGELRLRPLREDDVPRIVEACNDPVSRRWMSALPDPYDTTEARAWLQRGLGRAADGTAITWAVAGSADDRLAGALNLFDLSPQAPRSAEVGYWVHPDSRGRGVATAAARAALRHAFIPEDDGGLGLSQVIALVGAQNAASLKVIAAAGMHQVGVLRAGLDSGPAVLFEAVP